jgi:hypothetical protein
MVEALKRPTLTMPPDESAALIAAYEAATVILEYGTGGSTVVAADLPGRHVYSVESSAEWLAMMEGWFAANPPKAALHLHHGNIGKTREWGFPADNRQVAKWPNYPISVWDRADFQHPDVVLIDGRFRTACLYTTLFRITRPVTVLWDDYAERQNYHQVEQILEAPRMYGRMARFELKPMAFSPQRMALTIEAFMRPG